MHIESNVKERFPGISVVIAQISNVKIPKEARKIKRQRAIITDSLKKSYDLETLAEEKIIQDYRKFMWNVGIDPTKIRPSSEALIRRVLQNKELPELNPLIDAYNNISMKHGIPLSAYDYSKVVGKINIRSAVKGEKFVGIGNKELEMQGNEVVLSDQKKIMCVYPYRDANETKIRNSTKDVVVVGYGVPGIDRQMVLDAVDEATKTIIEICDAKMMGMVAID